MYIWLSRNVQFWNSYFSYNEKKKRYSVYSTSAVVFSTETIRTNTLGKPTVILTHLVSSARRITSYPFNCWEREKNCVLLKSVQKKWLFPAHYCTKEQGSILISLHRKGQKQVFYYYFYFLPCRLFAQASDVRLCHKHGPIKKQI